MEKKYLGELLKDVKFTSNNLVLSPTGSGKTYFILNDLANRYDHVLYLCDTSALKTQVNKDDENDKVKEMTYDLFGKMVEKDNSFVSNYDVIIADEFHNLLNYNRIYGSVSYSHAVKELIKKYKNTDIFYFTATPYEIEVEKKKFDALDKNITVYDYLDSTEIKRYNTKKTIILNSFYEIPVVLKDRHDEFTEKNTNILIYADRIDTMNKIKDMIDSIGGYRPVCIWSKNNPNHIMDDEQLRVYDCIIENCELPKEYNILIINKSMETGINIKQDNFQVVFTNSNNLTTRVQVRGRIRHDIDCCYVVESSSDLSKAYEYDYGNNTRELKIIRKYCNKRLTQQDKNMFCEELGRFNTKGRLVKWNTNKELIISLGFSITDGKYKMRGKQIYYSIIKEL